MSIKMYGITVSGNRLFVLSAVLITIARGDDETTMSTQTPITTTAAGTTRKPIQAGAHGSEPTKQDELSTMATRRRITPPPRDSVEDNCMYIAKYCMRAYKTGVLCGRTIYYAYANFTTYCELDYVNCMERYEVWQIVHMGECIPTLKLEHDYIHYQYTNVDFLYKDYVSTDE